MMRVRACFPLPGLIDLVYPGNYTLTFFCSGSRLQQFRQYFHFGIVGSHTSGTFLTNQRCVVRAAAPVTLVGRL
ncbi:MAG: hypothetical protein R2795_23180 [Saprospiraceae bacterium]